MTLKNRYNEIMNNIVVTDEMHDRIIQNIGNTDFSAIQRNVINFTSYKKYIAIAACFIILVVSATVIPSIMNINDNVPEQASIPDIVEYNTLDELSKAVGFPVPEINQVPFKVEKVTYIAYGKELAQIDYANNENSITFRKSIGKEDNSGNYNEYSNIKETATDKLTITLKGNSDSYNLAIWEKDGYSYSLQSTVSVSETEMLDMVKSISETD
jgi:hypothetical protein